MKDVFRGMALGLPIVWISWWQCYYNAKSHTAWIFANCFFSGYTVLMLVLAVLSFRRRKA